MIFLKENNVASNEVVSEDISFETTTFELSEMFDYICNLNEAMHKIRVDAMIATHKSIVNEDVSILNEAAKEAISRLIETIKDWIRKISDWIAGMYKRVLKKTGIMDTVVRVKLSKLSAGSIYENIDLFRAFDLANQIYLGQLGKASKKSKKDYDRGTEILKGISAKYNDELSRTPKLTYVGGKHGGKLIHLLDAVIANIKRVNSWQQEVQRDLEHFQSILSPLQGLDNSDPKVQEMVEEAHSAVRFHTAEQAAIAHYLVICEKTIAGIHVVANHLSGQGKDRPYKDKVKVEKRKTVFGKKVKG
jgi:hypothetical protein